MIILTRINKKPIYVNPHLIESIDEIPDTVLRLCTERTIIVREKAEEVVAKIMKYRKDISIRDQEAPDWPLEGTR